MSRGRAGLPDPRRRGRPPTPAATPALLHFPVRGCEGRILRGRPAGEGEAEADRPSAIRAPLGGARKPRRRAQPGPLLGRRRRAQLPGLGTSGPEPKGSGASAAQRGRRAAEHLPIHGPDGGAHSAETDGLTASEGRKRQQQGGSRGRASGGCPQPRRVGGGRRVGNRGGNQGRSRHRRAPAFPTPQARPRLASPRPSASTPSRGHAPGRPPARLQGALFRRAS